MLLGCRGIQVCSEQREADVWVSASLRSEYNEEILRMCSVASQIAVFVLFFFNISFYFLSLFFCLIISFNDFIHENEQHQVAGFRQIWGSHESNQI